MIDTDMMMMYLEFVEERHRIWVKRQKGDKPPWTWHKHLALRKFTNVFRVLDWDSQWLINNLLGPDESEVDILARCYLFRHTGLRAPWEFFMEQTGRYPYLLDMMDGTLLDAWQEYRGRANGVQLLDNGRTRGADKPVFTTAYQIYPGGTQDKGSDKLETIINRTTKLFDGPQFTAFIDAEDAAGRYEALRRHPGTGEFMAMQVLTDWGYSAQCGRDQENEFIQPGPGAIKGAKHLGPGVYHIDVIKQMREAVRALADCPRIQLADGRWRYPSLMDIQNTLCEFSKLVRYDTARGNIRQIKYTPAHPGAQPKPVFPAHW